MLKLIWLKHSYLIFLGIFLLILLAIGIYDLQQPMIAEADAYSRALIAKVWVEKNIFFQYTGSDHWLPFHFTLINLPSWLGVDVFFGQRLITLIFSLLSVAMLYFYTNEHLRQPKIALLASLFFGLLPLRLTLSTQTLTEVIFVFFFITALYFLVKETRRLLHLSLFALFFFLSGLIRFETWLFLPVVLAYLVLTKKLGFKLRLVSLLSVLLPPLGLLLINFLKSGTAFVFFGIKYSAAQNNPIPEFYHWQLSMVGWEKQLLKVFPLSFLLFLPPAYVDLFKKITPKKALFYLTPVYLFLILVVQVYLGTMEWFPARYLLIPLMFALPLLAKSIFSLGMGAINLVKQLDEIWTRFVILLLATLFLFSWQQAYQGAQTSTRLELTTFSFLSLNDSTLLPTKIDKIDSFFNLVEIVSRRYPNKPFIEYYFAEIERSWQDQALFYFLETHGVDLPKKDFAKLHSNHNLVVWEKEENNQEPFWQTNFVTVYENKHYSLLELVKQ